MRFPRVIAVCVLAAAALAWAGCGQPPAAPRDPFRLRTMPGDPATAGVPMFQVRVVRLQHRLRPDAPIEDVWRLLGTTNVPHEKRALWEANELRLGDGARLAADRMNELLSETPDRAATMSTLLVRENLDFVISVGGERNALDVLWTDLSGKLLGRCFEEALAEFRLVCRSDPDDPKAVRIALAPEVLYGREQMRWVRTETGAPIQRMSRESFVLADLAAEVRLSPGRLLVIGARRTSDVSLGGAMFYERRGPDLWYQTIIVTVERVVPGQAPEGEGVPLRVPPKTRARAPAPAKAAPPAKTKGPARSPPPAPAKAEPPKKG